MSLLEEAKKVKANGTLNDITDEALMYHLAMLRLANACGMPQNEDVEGALSCGVQLGIALALEYPQIGRFIVNSKIEGPPNDLIMQLVDDLGL